MGIFESLQFYFQFSYVRYALIVGILISVCAAIFGVTLVLKHLSFIGDGLSHVAFGVMCIAAVLNLTDDMIFTIPVTVIAAILLICTTGNNSKVKGDASIAIISISALAVGYFIMNVFSTSANVAGDVCSTLFGSTSILTLSKVEVWVCVGLSIAIILIFILFYNKIFAVTFDESFSRAVGGKAKLYNLLIAIIMAVVIVLAMNLVGSLLVSALVIFPALTAMRVFKSFKGVIICAAIVSVVNSTIGLLVSILWSTPVGATIVIVDLVVLGVFYIIGFFKGYAKA
ncbi:MAG: metal ABC transporter permease [Clostridia bacterium]|nr:metal ABC transporter permease [Clostridia bacterium]